MEKYKIKLDIKDEVISKILSSFLQNIYLIVHDNVSEYDIAITDYNDCNDNSIIFVNTPIRLGDLLDRIERKLASKTTSNIIENINFGNFILHTKIKKLSYNKNIVQLTEKEMAILLYFYSNIEVCINKEELLKNVWGYNSSVDTRTIETHIYRLRQKIANISNNTELIITLEDGYKLLI